MPAVTRIPARLEAGKINARPWEVKGELGKRLGWSAGGGASGGASSRRRWQWRAADGGALA
jgi:hypothetical protein